MKPVPYRLPAGPRAVPRRYRRSPGLPEACAGLRSGLRRHREACATAQTARLWLPVRAALSVHPGSGYARRGHRPKDFQRLHRLDRQGADPCGRRRINSGRAHVCPHAPATTLDEKIDRPFLRVALSSSASATVKLGGRVSRWCTISSPCARTCDTFPGATLRPLIARLPRSAVARPEQKRASVVLPAPFCPRSV